MERSPRQIYSKNPDIVYRCVAGSAILVPVGSNSEELGAIFTLNETAARIWELIDGSRSADDIAAIISGEFEVAVKQAAADTRACLKDLEAVNAVKKT